MTSSQDVPALLFNRKKLAYHDGRELNLRSTLFEKATELYFNLL